MSLFAVPKGLCIFLNFFQCTQFVFQSLLQALWDKIILIFWQIVKNLKNLFRYFISSITYTMFSTYVFYIMTMISNLRCFFSTKMFQIHYANVAVSLIRIWLKLFFCYRDLFFSANYFHCLLLEAFTKSFYAILGSVSINLIFI